VDAKWAIRAGVATYEVDLIDGVVAISMKENNAAGAVVAIMVYDEIICRALKFLKHSRSLFGLSTCLRILPDSKTGL
jgi:hypothetical protein